MSSFAQKFRQYFQKQTFKALISSKVRSGVDFDRRVNLSTQRVKKDTYVCLLIVLSISCRSDFWCNIGGRAYALCEATKHFPCCCSRIVDRGPIVTRSCQTEITNAHVTITCKPVRISSGNFNKMK